MSEEEKKPWMPIREDLDILPADNPENLKLGFVCRILNHGDKYDDTLGKQEEKDYVGKMDVPHGIYTTIEVLQFLYGRPYNNLAWNWIIGLRPKGVIHSNNGMNDLMCRTDWITVYTDKDDIIQKIVMEINPGQIGVHHGHDLHLATFQKNYKQETHVNSIFFNPKGIEKLTFDLEKKDD